MSDPLEPFRVKFRERAAEDRLAIEALDPADPACERLVHNLAGAAGTFGFTEVSDIALAIDDLYAAKRVPSDEDIGRLITALAAIS